MIREAIEVLDKKGDGTYLCLDSGAVIVGFELSLLDVEVRESQFQQIEQGLIHFLRELDPQLQVRFVLEARNSWNPKAELSKEDVASKTHSRTQSLKEVGYFEERLFVFFETATTSREVFGSLRKLFTNKNLFQEKSTELKNLMKLDLFKSCGFQVRTLKETEYHNFYLNAETPLDSKGSPFHGQIVSYEAHLHFGTEVMGLVKMVKQSNHAISFDLLAGIRQDLPAPYRIVVLVKNVASYKSESELRRKSSQQESGSDKVSLHKYIQAQDDLAKIAIQGARLIEVEFQVVQVRETVATLQNDLNRVVEVLRPLGKFYVENYGLERAFKSTLLGECSHVPFLELDEVVPSYLPIAAFGKSRLELEQCSRKENLVRDSTFKNGSEKTFDRRLLLHRRDRSLDYFDVYNPLYDSFSTCIFGLPGSGKSILTNMITRALLEDPQVQIIKLDVGGSHSRETQIWGGHEVEFAMDRPTGFNPLEFVIGMGDSPEMVQILGSFIETLVREEREFSVSKEMRSDIEKALFKYASQNPEKPSIDDFVLKCGDCLPRVKLLERWGGRGVYGNAFRSSPDFNIHTQNRLKYFNFVKISQALDGDFAQGGLAAVMAAFNYDILFNRGSKRFVFIADEVPIFIEKCFHFFALSIANIRKNGDAFITIAQRSEHVVVNGNTSILDNSPSKFLFSVDGNRELFAKRLGLTNADVQKIENLQRVQGQLSQVFHVDSLGKKVFQLILSPEEYWSYTSKREDKDKIEALLKHLPYLTIGEAIACLSLS